MGDHLGTPGAVVLSNIPSGHQSPLGLTEHICLASKPIVPSNCNKPMGYADHRLLVPVAIDGEVT